MENYDVVFFFKQKTEYEMRIIEWSSDVCYSDLSFRKFRRTLALRTEGCRERADLGHARRQDLGRHEEAGRLWAFVYHARHIWRHRSVGITGQVLFQPPSDLKFLLSADYSEINQPSPTQVATNIRSEEQKSEHQSLMRISYAVFCLKKKIKK